MSSKGHRANVMLEQRKAVNNTGRTTSDAIALPPMPHVSKQRPLHRAPAPQAKYVHICSHVCVAHLGSCFVPELPSSAHNDACTAATHRLP
eukprot:10013124-Alexandrium_andersonii.AAC.1